MKDLDIIKQIEKELNVRLKKLDEIEQNSNGCALNQDGHVTSLGLYGCKIENLNRIISPLKDLKNLTELDLCGNHLSDISPLKDLKNLKKLYIGRNRISDISHIRDLNNLTHLYLESNQIRDISHLKGLKKLNYLNLRINPIEELPQWITDFDMSITWAEEEATSFQSHEGICFYDNPLKSPPVEIVEQGREAMRNYFEQIKEQGKDNIYEAKLMLVGEPGSGKTSLMNKLFDRKFPVPNDEQKSTLGIDVRQNWEFSIDYKKKFNAHIWDFGGQQIQYMLHQFFLTSDCLYVLMAEKRRELANFDYWLNIINILGKNSPVVILFNEINIDSATSFIYDEKKYKELFSGMNLKKTGCKSFKYR